MPTRRTKGRSARSISGDYDVLICGASFAGLAVARELADAPRPARVEGLRGTRGPARPDRGRARVLIVDRYEIGERQTSACGIPTEWLTVLGLEDSMCQTFGELVVHTPQGTARLRLPWTFSTFDYPTLCELLAAEADADFETATVVGRSGDTVHTDRGDLSAPLIVDALGWRRLLAADDGYQPVDAPLSRALEVHPFGRGDHMEIWIDRSYVPAGYGWSFPASEELRIGVGSFDPRFHVKGSTVRLADDLDSEAVRYQGNWIPHKLRAATEGGIFFCGDSAGHCLPLTAEGIRTALYFGIACGRELRRVLEGRSTRMLALRRYHAFCASHEWQFAWMLRMQRLVPRVAPRLLTTVLRRMESRGFLDWAFGHYLDIAHPSFAAGTAPRRRPSALRTAGERAAA
jgi:menaquinone-9 beta-reductase